MNDVELEQVATGTHRWIEYCAALEKNHPNESGTGAKLYPRITRIIEDSSLLWTADSETGHPLSFDIVPGGRDLVGYSVKGTFLWDSMGYTSSADCKLIASVEPAYCCLTHATLDGIGLIMSSSHPYART